MLETISSKCVRHWKNGLYGCLLLSIIGCSPAPQTGAGEQPPQAGEQHQYLLQSELQFTHEQDTSPTTSLTYSLLNYQVQRSGDTLQLTLTPQLWLTNPSGYRPLTRWPSNKSSIQMLLAKGFKLKIALADGELLDFSPVISLHTPTDSDDHQTLEQTWNYLQQTPAFSGWRPIVFPVPRLTPEQRSHAKVMHSTPDRLYLQIEGGYKVGQSMVTLVIDRHTGWLLSLGAVASGEVSFNRFEDNKHIAGHFHQRTLLRNVDRTHLPVSPQWTSDKEQQRFTTRQFIPSLTATPATTAPISLANKRGSYTVSSTELAARFSYYSKQGDMRQMMRLGLLDIHPITPIDRTQQAVDVPMLVTDAESTSAHELQMTIAIDGSLEPKDIPSFSGVRATINRYALTMQPLTLPLKQQPSQWAEGGILAELSPTAAARTYELTVYADNRDFLTLAPDSKETLTVTELTPALSEASWIQAADQQLLATGLMRKRYRLTFNNDTLPAQLALQRWQRSDKPVEQQQVIFTILGDTPDPLSERPVTIDKTPSYQLLDHDTFVSGPEIKDHQLIMRLPWPALSVCRLTSNTPALNGHALVWGPTRFDTYGRNNLLLQTDDGIRTHFYGRVVKTTLRCPGQPIWKTIDVAPAPYPWLVDIKALPEFDEHWQASDIQSRYRFLDSEGTTLNIEWIDRKQEAGREPITAGHTLLQGRYLRIYGDIAHIQRAATQGEPLTKQWTHVLKNYPQ